MKVFCSHFTILKPWNVRKEAHDTHYFQSVAIAIVSFGIAAFIAIVVSAAAQAHEVKIGVIAGLTKHGATYGKGIVQGAEMAVREINAAAGVDGHTIKLVVVDDASNPARSAIAMRRLVGNNVDLIVGGWGSSQVLANLDIAEQAGIPYVVVGATNPRITSEKNKWTFRVIQTDSVMARQLAETAVGFLGLKRIAIINDANAYGRGSRDVFVAALAEAGIEPTDIQSYDTANKDFQTQLKQIQANRPDAIAIFGTLPAAPLIMMQARALGIKAQFIGTGGLANESLMDLASEDAEGTILMSFYDEDADAQAQAWSDRYRREFEGEGDNSHPILAVWEYRAIRYIVAPCLKPADTNRTLLRDCIANWKGHLFGLDGELYFDNSGQLVQPPIVVQVKNGKFQTVRQKK